MCHSPASNAFGIFRKWNCLISHSTATQRRPQSGASPLCPQNRLGNVVNSKRPGPPRLQEPGPLHSLLALQVSLYTSGLRSTAMEPQKNVQATKTEESVRYMVNGEKDTWLTGKTQVHHSVFRCQAHKTGVKMKGEE